jgi:type IV secretion system protein VirD4
MQDNQMNPIVRILFIGVPLLAFCIGLWMSTQRYAAFYGYAPWLGAPLFVLGGTPVYQPVALFGWIFENSLTEMMHTGSFEYVSLPFFIGVAVAVMTLYGFGMRKSKNRVDGIHGTARWAEVSDLKKAGLLARSGIALAQLNDAKIRFLSDAQGNTKITVKKISRPIIAGGDAQPSALICLPSGGGKGIGPILSTLLPTKPDERGRIRGNAGGHLNSCIILDFKGENFSKTAAYRAKVLGHKIFRFDPTSSFTIKYNPLADLRPGVHLYDDARLLAETLLPEGQPGKSNEAEDYFRNQAIIMLTGSILHCLTSDYPDKSLGGVLDFISSGVSEDDDEMMAFLEDMKEATHIDDSTHQHIENAANLLLSKGPRELGSVIGTVSKGLSVFESDIVRENTSTSHFSLDDFLASNADKQPVSFYICVPYGRVGSLKGLIKVFFEFFIKRLTSDVTEHGKKPLNDLLLLLDEFPLLGASTFMSDSMGILRGYGIRVMIVVQTLQQLITLYGQNHPFLDHCQVRMFGAPGDEKSAETISKLLGDASVWKESTSHSGSRFEAVNKNINVSGQEMRRPLMYPAEVNAMDKSEVIISPQGEPPYKAKKLAYFAHPEYAPRASLPAPTKTEQLLKQFGEGWETYVRDPYGWLTQYVPPKPKKPKFPAFMTAPVGAPGGRDLRCLQMFLRDLRLEG